MINFNLKFNNKRVINVSAAQVENLATIRKLTLNSVKIFNSYRETGAGKSIMIDAILLALGHRGDSAMIRSGQEQTVVGDIFFKDDSEKGVVGVHETGRIGNCC